MNINLTLKWLILDSRFWITIIFQVFFFILFLFLKYKCNIDYKSDRLFKN